VLTHFRLCPHSRSIRLALKECQVDVAFVEERPWEWQPEFLAMNPAGELPVLSIAGGPDVAGAYAISEYIADVTPLPEDGQSFDLFPGTATERAETRRLVDWFHGKLNREVTHDLLTEKIYARLQPVQGHTPNSEVLRAVQANLRYHLSYIGHLADQRWWLGGDRMSFADLAAGAHLSSIDYLGDVPWQDFPSAKSWYQRLKSRPSFRPILADRLAGTPPPPAYDDLDF
jgi:glutathione S-transferase